jgi:hypothetical protein
VGSSVVRINLLFVSEALLWYHRQPAAQYQADSMAIRPARQV